MKEMNRQVIESLAERMKVVILNQGMWNPVRQHHGETAAENRRHNLDNENDASVYIRLTKHPALQDVIAVKGKIYNTHKKLTLPSPCDGMRIVPAVREFEHCDAISELITEYNKHKEEFLEAYPDIVEKVRSKLEPKGLWDHNFFPPDHVMRNKFYNTFQYMPAPTQGTWGEWIEQSVEVGKVELQERIVKAARKMAEACAGDGKLFSSVIDNLEEICDMAGDFNLTEDPIIAKAAKELKTVARDYPVEVLREHKGLRSSSADRVNSILKAMNLG